MIDLDPYTILTVFDLFPNMPLRTVGKVEIQVTVTPDVLDQIPESVR